jgi:hypothetical protein
MTNTSPVFGQPFKEQVAFFKQKLNLPTEHYDDILHSQHDRAFIVAGAMKAELLTDLRESVRAAIEDGETLAQFRQRFNSIVKKNGWTGWAGEGSEVGVAWRTKIIYATNLRTSHAAGRWQQMTDPDVMAMRPYWRYRHTTVEHPRMQHKQWDGLILPAKHEWFLTHYAPNGWGCNCRIETLSKRDFQKLGKSAPDKAPNDGTYQTTARDGSIIELPNGVQYGWGHAAGATWHPDLNRYPYQIAKDYVKENMKDGVFERWLKRIDTQVKEEIAKPDYKDLPKEQIIEKLRKLDRREEYPIAIIPEKFQKILGLNTQVLLFSEYDAVKQAYSRLDDKNFTIDAYQDVQHILEDPNQIVRETLQGNQQMTVWLQRGKHSYIAILQQTKTGKGLFLKSFRFGGGDRELKRALVNAKGILLHEKK